jgi:hypothetical protein
MMTSLLSTRALLVRPSWSVWRGEITDRAASNATAEQHKADRKQVRTTKFLVSKEVIDPIASEAGAMRSFVRQETLPWRWDGVSLLPTDNYLHFCEGWRDRKAAFDGAVSTLIRGWHLHVLAGQRALGTLANEYDYPSREEVAGRFSATIEVFPVPDAADFRAAVSESEAEAIRQQLSDYADAQLRDAQSYLWQQMQEHVGHIAERLAAYGKDEATGKVVGKFHDTLIGNLRLLCDRLSRLNVTADPAIEAMRQELKAKLCPYEPDDLRQDDGLRASVKDEAERLIQQMQSIYPMAEAAE